MGIQKLENGQTYQIFFIPDDISVDAKPGWAGVHGSGHLVKSEYTLPGETGSGSGGSGGPGEAGGPTHILPDTSGQSLPPLMHMGYAVGRHAQVREKMYFPVFSLIKRQS